MTEQKYRIWSDLDLDYEDWRADLEADYPELTEDERMMLMHEINGGYLDDERANLNIQLDQPILIIADLGLWTGRHMGYKEIASGNIRDCLYSDRDIDYSTWYVDRLGDLRCDAIHHDGTNHLSAPGRFCSFSPNRKCRKMAGKGVQPLDNYTCRFCLSSLKQADKSGLDRLQAGKLAGV